MLSSKIHRLLKLSLCTCLISFIQFVIGCSLVFSSVLLAKLKEPSSHIKINVDEESWIASVPILICPIGLLIIGVLADKIGRRKALQIAFLPLITSWLVLAYANSLKSIIIGRIILGISMGSGLSTYLYLGEVCPTEYRPLLFSVATIFVGVGMMSEFVFAIFFHWQTVSMILFVVSVIGCGSLFLLPETPMWLRKQGRIREAEAAKKWLGEDRVAAATVHVVTANAVVATDELVDVTHTGWKSLMEPIVWKPTLLTFSFFVCQQGSGFYVLLFYSVDVLKNSHVQWDGFTVTVFLSVSRVIGSLVFSILHHVRRKTLTVVSGCGMALSLTVIVSYIHIYKDVVDPPYEILQISAFIMYVFFALLAMLPLPWIICGEVFPMSVKGTISGIVQVFGYEVMFIVIKIYPSMVLKFGIENVFTAFAAFSLASALFGAFIMPETKGKSLNEILRSFESRKKSIKNNLP